MFESEPARTADSRARMSAKSARLSGTGIPCRAAARTTAPAIEPISVRRPRSRSCSMLPRFAEVVRIDGCAFCLRDRRGLSAHGLKARQQVLVPDKPSVRDAGDGGERIDRCVHDELRPEFCLDVVGDPHDDARVREEVAQTNEIRLLDPDPRAEDRLADSRVANLAGPEERHAVRRGPRDDSLCDLRDRLGVPEAVLHGDEQCIVRERTQCNHRLAGVVRLRRDENQFGLRSRGDAGGRARPRDHHRLPGDPEAARADRRHVLRSSDERHVVTSRQETAEETPHRARTEDDDSHVPRMHSRGKNGFVSPLASRLFYKIRKMNDLSRFRYF